MSQDLAPTASWIRQLADLLGLRDWEFRIADEPCPEEEDAHIECAPGQRVAIISLSTRWLDEPVEEQRHTLVHELLHCHFHETQACVERAVGTLLGTVGGSVVSGEHMNHLEHGVDAVAVAVAPLLPTPDPHYGWHDRRSSDGDEVSGAAPGTVRSPCLTEQDRQAGVPDWHTFQSRER